MKTIVFAPLSLTPCFSGVFEMVLISEPLQRFVSAGETVETVFDWLFAFTGLKPGVNESESSRTVMQKSKCTCITGKRVDDGTVGELNCPRATA